MTGRYRDLPLRFTPKSRSSQQTTTTAETTSEPMSAVRRMEMTAEGVVCCDGMSYTPLSPSRVLTMPFDGKDPYFVDGLICGNCNAPEDPTGNPPKSLFLCMHCRLVPCCSKACQKKHYRPHREICMAIQQARADKKRVEEDENATPEDHIRPYVDLTNVLRMIVICHNAK